MRLFLVTDWAASFNELEAAVVLADSPNEARELVEEADLAAAARPNRDGSMPPLRKGARLVVLELPMERGIVHGNGRWA